MGRVERQRTPLEEDFSWDDGCPDTWNVGSNDDRIRNYTSGDINSEIYMFMEARNDKIYWMVMDTMRTTILDQGYTDTKEEAVEKVAAYEGAGVRFTEGDIEALYKSGTKTPAEQIQSDHIVVPTTKVKGIFHGGWLGIERLLVFDQKELEEVFCSTLKYKKYSRQESSSVGVPVTVTKINELDVDMDSLAFDIETEEFNISDFYYSLYFEIPEVEKRSGVKFSPEGTSNTYQADISSLEKGESLVMLLQGPTLEEDADGWYFIAGAVRDGEVLKKNERHVKDISINGSLLTITLQEDLIAGKRFSDLAGIRSEIWRKVHE